MNSSASSVLAAIVIISFVLPATVASAPASPKAGWAPLVTLAPVDVRGLAESVDTSGRGVVTVAGRPLEIVLEEHDIFAPGGRAIVEVSPDFTQTVVGHVTARTFRGSVADATPSAAVVTLDAPRNALRGSIFLDERAYFVRTVEVDGQVLLETTWEESSTPVPGVAVRHSLEESGDVSTFGAGNKYTFVRPVGSTQYAADPTWTTHVTDVFNQQHAMWDNQVFIHQYIGPFTTMPNHATGSCGALLDHFEAFVGGGIQSGWLQDAFQLFDHNDIDCAGLANARFTYEERITHNTQEMTSVLQAHDHSIWDNMDPDNSYHLGLVSAQELSHNYGEWEHPMTCRAWNFWGNCIDYNVMAAGADPDDVGFWWTTTSHNRIYHDSYGQL